MALRVPISKQFLAEFIGTFWLVLGGCGSAVLAAVFPYDNAAANPLGLGFLGVSLAFGLTLLTAAYAIGHIWQVPRFQGVSLRGGPGAGRPHRRWPDLRHRQWS